jgi:hypothetical protein
MATDFPIELIEQFARGNGVIFVGPGLSQLAGLPGMDDLASELAAELDGCPPDANPRDIAQYYVIEHERHRLVQKLRVQLETLNVQPTPVHKALAQLPVSAIFTSAYDDLLEKALRTIQRPFTFVIGNVDASFWSSDQLQLVKLHGDLNQPKSIIITSKDYERFAIDRSALIRLLTTTLETHTALFIGYDTSDPNLRLILTAISSELHNYTRNLYTLQFGLSRLVAEDLEQRGLKVIDLGEQANAAQHISTTLQWISTFSKKVKKNTKPQTPNISEPTPKTPVEILADEVRFWLEVRGYAIHKQTHLEDWAIDIHAELPEGITFLVRCVEGEAELQHVQELEQVCNQQNLPLGWLIVDRRVARSAQEHARHKKLRIFTLPDFIRDIFGSYFDSLTRLVEESELPNYYVDLSAVKPVFDEKGNKIDEDEYQVIDDYIEAWLQERSKSHLSILGDFGSGKTWFCRHFAHKQLQRYLADPLHERLPILITLRDYVKEVDVSSLIRKLLDEQGIRLGKGFETFEALNRRGKLLLIFDGFDEMAVKVDYQIVVDYFWELARLVVPGSKALLTCRTGYFRYATEAEKVMYGEELGREMIEVQPPKFEVIYLKPFTDEQITEVISRRRDPEAATTIMANPNLKELAKQPVLIEMLIQALPELQPDVPINLSGVYRLALNSWLERDIRTGRTFMDKWDKLFFMMELAWEMIRTDNLKVHYKALPDKISHHFGLEKHDEKDHYDYDIRTKSFLRRDATGNYEFMHKSLAEYLVAFKFSMELGSVDQDYVADIPESVEPQTALSLRHSFGAKPLTKMPEIGDFMAQMTGDIRQLERIIIETKPLTFEDVRYVGGNAVSVLKRLDSYDFIGFDFSDAVLVEADFTNTDLTDANFQHANLQRAELRFTTYAGKTLDGEALEEYILSSSLFKEANLQDVDWHITRSYTRRSYGCFPTGTSIRMSDGTDKPIEEVQIGDWVLSYCEDMKTFEESQVIGTFEGEATSFVHLNESLRITPSESIFTGRQWIKAGDVKRGQSLLTLIGQLVIHSVERIQQKGRIFNLSLQPHHNFFANRTLVHNVRRKSFG